MRSILIIGVVTIIINISIAAWFFFGIPEKRNLDSEAAVPQESFMSERVEFATKDGTKIIGDYYSVKSPRGVLLLHMMPADRKSWVEFAGKLQKAGFQALAIDLRGHGESEGGPNGYRNFSDSEHQASRLDVEAGAEFLKARGVSELHLVGASIGANLALQYLAEHPEVRSAILLSPGLNYRGVLTVPALEKVSEVQGAFFVAADDDAYSRDTVLELSQKFPFEGRRLLKIFDAGGHGTKLFEAHPEFMEELIEWLRGL